jgi:hypothetical protein
MHDTDFLSEAVCLKNGISGNLLLADPAVWGTYRKPDFSGTPLTIVIADGKVISHEGA